jgi:uncharacterized protein (DUF2249 family)
MRPEWSSGSRSARFRRAMAGRRHRRQALTCVKAAAPFTGYLMLVMSQTVVRLDVREDIRNGREPFARIMQEVAQLKSDEQLLLIAPFEPAPLYAVLTQQGFSRQTKPTETGDYEVLFTRSSRASPGSDTPPAPGETRRPPQSSSCSGPAMLDIDARGLEPPQPLVKILEAVAAMSQGARLRAHTDRRPMHLYAQLEERGFIGESEEQSDGSFVTQIRRRD